MTIKYRYWLLYLSYHLSFVLLSGGFAVWNQLVLNVRSICQERDLSTRIYSQSILANISLLPCQDLPINEIQVFFNFHPLTVDMHSVI